MGIPTELNVSLELSDIPDEKTDSQGKYYSENDIG
jgi:hypothetical protein